MFSVEAALYSVVKEPSTQLPLDVHLGFLDAKNESDFIKRTMEFLNGDWEKAESKKETNNWAKR